MRAPTHGPDHRVPGLEEPHLVTHAAPAHRADAHPHLHAAGVREGAEVVDTRARDDGGVLRDLFPVVLRPGVVVVKVPLARQRGDVDAAPGPVPAVLHQVGVDDGVGEDAVDGVVEVGEGVVVVPAEMVLGCVGVVGAGAVAF